MPDSHAGLEIRDAADAALPGPRVLVRNVSGESRTLTVGITRDGRRRAATVTLPGGAGRTVDVPAGEGPVTAEIHAEGADAAITFGPDGRAPLFLVRERSVLVAPS